MVLVIRRRTGLGDMNSDMHAAAMSAPVVTELPNRAPYMAAFNRAGQVYINLSEYGETEPPNWVSYTDSFSGVTDAQTTAYWGGQGVEVAIPGWTAQQAANDPAGYQAALAQWRAQNAGVITSITNQIQGAQAAESSATNAVAAQINDAQVRSDAEAAADSFVRSGGMFLDTLTPGQVYPDYFLRGMLTRAQWIEDYISRATGGAATNTDRWAGKIQPGAPIQKTAPVVVPTSTSQPTQPAVDAPSPGELGLPSYSAPTYVMPMPDAHFANANGGERLEPGGTGMDLTGRVAGPRAAAPASGGRLSGGMLAALGLGALALFGVFSRRRS
jgi:hypothetical protein